MTPGAHLVLDSCRRRPPARPEADRRRRRALSRASLSSYRGPNDVSSLSMSTVEFVSVNVAVLTVSDTRTLETDRSGEAIVEGLAAAGHKIVDRVIVPDDLSVIRAAFQGRIDDEEIDVVIATGGTGITARDVTPEALAPLVTKRIQGFGELFRSLSYAEIGSSTIQSRAEAALCTYTLVFLLPGSTGAVKLAMDKIILSQLDKRTRPCNFVELMPRFRPARD